MSQLPLHPAIVHLPLGIALILPLMAFVLFIGIRRGWFSFKTWSLVVLLHFLMVASAFVALKTGENEEEKVEKVVAESALEEHEELAEIFLITSGVTFLLTGSVLIFKQKQTLFQGIALLGICTSTAMALNVGHSGGKLVYEHGAASAYTTGSAADGKYSTPSAETQQQTAPKQDNDD